MAAPAPRPVAAAVADTLARLWPAETEIDTGSARFIDSTFSNPSAAELARLVADETHPERDGLLELLFAPEESHRLAVESFLDSSATVDEAEVARRLARRVGRARFRLPDGRGAFEFEVTAGLAESFVRRLALSRRIPDALRHGLEAVSGDPERRQACVVLRHSGLRFTPAREAMLARLIERSGAADEPFRRLLAFALEVLKSVDTADELWAYLAGRKRRLIEAVDHDARQADRLARDGFEVAQSRGRRLAWIDRSAAEVELRSIDRLGLAIFGRIPHAGIERLEAAFDRTDPAGPPPD
jgi:hypothetical protein